MAWGLSAVTVTPTYAQPKGELDTRRVLECAQERDGRQRLACYDAAVAAAHAVPQPAVRDTPPASPASPPQEARVVMDDFGVKGSAVARQRQAEQASERPQVRTVSAQVISATTLPRGEWVITLDNGQVWQQKTPDPAFTVKPGDAVRINAGALGSYRMLNGRRATQVTRLE